MLTDGTAGAVGEAGGAPEDAALVAGGAPDDAALGSGSPASCSSPCRADFRKGEPDKVEDVLAGRLAAVDGDGCPDPCVFSLWALLCSDWAVPRSLSIQVGTDDRALAEVRMVDDEVLVDMRDLVDIREDVAVDEEGEVGRDDPG